MAMRLLPDIETLNKFLVCDPEAGTLIWKRRPLSVFPTTNVCGCWNGKYAEKPAFQTKNRLGYLYGQIEGQRLMAHRVIWKMATGLEPDVIDHINGIVSDNRISNMRSVSHTENMRNRNISSNNKTGANGVDKWNGRYRARINHGGRTYHIGMFDTVEQAKEAQRAKALEIGFTLRHGT